MSGEDETLNLNGENIEVAEETSSMFNFTNFVKILGVLVILYLFYTYYNSLSSGPPSTPISVPYIPTPMETAVSSAFGH